MGKVLAASEQIVLGLLLVLLLREPDMEASNFYGAVRHEGSSLF